MRSLEQSEGLVAPEPDGAGDLCSLIAQFRDGAPGAAELLFQYLEPTVQRIALEVTRGWSGWEKDDFLDNALSDLLAPRPRSQPRILLYEASRGSLEGWLASTLRNLWCSARRRRVPTTSTLPADVPSPESRLDLEEPANALGLTFEEADLRRIEGWPPRVRVELLTMSGLFVKVPPDMWERFLNEWELERHQTLVRPFPPEKVFAAEDPAARTQPLAAALEMPANTLSQRWKRGKERLDELDFVKQLRRAAT